jgi:hypothetical protein
VTSLELELLRANRVKRERGMFAGRENASIPGRPPARHDFVILLASADSMRSVFTVPRPNSIPSRSAAPADIDAK